MAKNNRPTTSFRSGLVKAHIWTNTTKDGKPFFKVTVERIYKDDTWKRTSSFGSFDLADLARVAIVAEQEVGRLETSTDGKS